MRGRAGTRSAGLGLRHQAESLRRETRAGGGEGVGVSEAVGGGRRPRPAPGQLPGEPQRAHSLPEAKGRGSLKNEELGHQNVIRFYRGELVFILDSLRKRLLRRFKVFMISGKKRILKGSV